MLLDGMLRTHMDKRSTASEALHSAWMEPPAVRVHPLRKFDNSHFLSQVLLSHLMQESSATACAPVSGTAEKSSGAAAGSADAPGAAAAPAADAAPSAAEASVPVDGPAAKLNEIAPNDVPSDSDDDDQADEIDMEDPLLRKQKAGMETRKQSLQVSPRNSIYIQLNPFHFNSIRSGHRLRGQASRAFIVSY